MNINTLFDEALLAQAAYANLTAELTTKQLITALKKQDGVTQAQAGYFASRYTVIQQTNNPTTGFSATLFQNIDTGEYHLATRGSAVFSFTEPDWIDANADNFSYGIVYEQEQAEIYITLRKAA